MMSLIYLSTFVVLVSVSSSKLLFVYEHFRHGARGPCDGLDSFNLDYLKIKWDTLGELSGIGMRMQYLLGYRNRLRYKNFLSENYDPREILVISTDVNRTIHSAISNLQGMYPPSTGPTLTPNQINNAVPPNKITQELQDQIKQLDTFALPNQMQTIPYHLFYKDDHDFTLHEVNNCEQVQPIRAQNIIKTIIKNKAKEFNSTYYDQFMKYYKYTNPNQLLNWTYINYWCDHFIADITEDRDLSPFSQLGIDLKTMTDQCHEILRLQLYEVVFGDEGERIALMSMTRPMKKILYYMNQRINYDQDGTSDMKHYSAPRFVVHSAHDTTMGAMVVFLKIALGTKIINPKYASNLYLELKKKDSNIIRDLSDYYVEYYFEDELLISIPFSEFNKSVTDLFWEEDQIDKFCNFPNKENRNNIETTLWCVIGGLIAIICILIGVLIYVCCYIKKRNSFRGMILPEVIDQKIS